MVIQQNENNPMKALRVCRFCEREKEMERAKLISHRDFRKKTENLENYPISRIVEDPTVPVLETKECPNDECKKNNALVKMHELSEEQKKFLYICTECYHYWTNV